MSDVKHAPVCYPPPFPLQGRLPRHGAKVYQNIRLQRDQEDAYLGALRQAAGRLVQRPCCQTLHITLCFDGTGNNLNNDLYESQVPHPTNVVRMFRASIGDGYAGGTAHRGENTRLTDAPGTGNGQFYKYYMPGVGTPFPEVGDLDYSLLSLGTGWAGEERINWALLMIIDALRRLLKQPRLDNTALLASVKAMGTRLGAESLAGYGNRSREFHKQLAALDKPLRVALTQPSAGYPKLLGIKLFVYGFSRGASLARAFVSYLNQLVSGPTPSLSLLDLSVPVSVEYLGLLDSVASVGLADIVPGTTGHMGWADGTQALPEGRLVKRCLHLVASHEQRLSFPLESIRRESGEYPANSEEVVYPGVHTDLGGGYPPGEQGKSIGRDDRLLLSQIALHDLYIDAFAHGAPLKVPKDSLPIDLRNELWRAMETNVERSFAVAPTLINRFNAWRQVTLNQPAVQQPLSPEQTEHYHPLPSRHPLEDAVREQMGWLTGWRIDRYAFVSLKGAPFYQQASDTQADKVVRERAEAEHKTQQQALNKRRREHRARERFSGEPKTPLEPGLKDFDADMAQTQLREAAEECGAHYRGPSPLTLVALRVGPLLLLNTAHALAERQRIKAAGRSRVSQLFPPPYLEKNHLDEYRRGEVAEHRNASQPEGLLRALFDDQVHDSRAWFLYSSGRELGGSYFAERMLFFGERGRRELVLYREDNGQMIAVTPDPLPDTSPSPITEAERIARLQQAVMAPFNAFYAALEEGNDVQS